MHRNFFQGQLGRGLKYLPNHTDETRLSSQEGEEPGQRPVQFRIAFASLVKPHFKESQAYYQIQVKWVSLASILK